MIEKIFKKIEHWQVKPEFLSLFLENGLSDFNSSYQSTLFNDKTLITSSPTSAVYKIKMGGRHFYIKKYNGLITKLRRYFLKNKLKGECDNFIWFKEHGIPTAKVVAFGRETYAWITKRAILITEEIAHTYDLVKIVESKPELINNNKWIADISHQLASICRCLHQNNFTHNDFKWRNILIDLKSEKPKVYLIDCPVGQKWIWPFLQYRIIKDLACLDKRAKHHLSKSQRLAFYKDYAQCNKLTSKHKKQIHKILKFFHNRE